MALSSSASQGNMHQNSFHKLAQTALTQDDFTSYIDSNNLTPKKVSELLTQPDHQGQIPSQLIRTNYSKENKDRVVSSVKKLMACQSQHAIYAFRTQLPMVDKFALDKLIKAIFVDHEAHDEVIESLADKNYPFLAELNRIALVIFLENLTLFKIPAEIKKISERANPREIVDSYFSYFKNPKVLQLITVLCGVLNKTRDSFLYSGATPDYNDLSPSSRLDVDQKIKGFRQQERSNAALFLQKTSGPKWYDTTAEILFKLRNIDKYHYGNCLEYSAKFAEILTREHPHIDYEYQHIVNGDHVFIAVNFPCDGEVIEIYCDPIAGIIYPAMLREEHLYDFKVFSQGIGFVLFNPKVQTVQRHPDYGRLTEHAFDQAKKIDLMIEQDATQFRI